MSKPYGPYSDQVEAFIASINGKHAYGYADPEMEPVAENIWYHAVLAIRHNDDLSEQFEAAQDALIEKFGESTAKQEQAVGAIIAQEHIGEYCADALLSPFRTTLEALSAVKKAQAAA